MLHSLCTGTRSFCKCRLCQQLYLAWYRQRKCKCATLTRVNWKGLTVYAWGSTEFREKNNEIDLSLEYAYKNLTLYANNYFTQTEDEPFKYFNYNSHSTGHTFEVGAGYIFSEKFPLSVSWYTTFAGNDTGKTGNAPGRAIAN